MSQGCEGVVSQQAGRVSWDIPAGMASAVFAALARGWQQQEAVPRQGINDADAACPVKAITRRTTISHEKRVRTATINNCPC